MHEDVDYYNKFANQNSMLEHTSTMSTTLGQISSKQTLNYTLLITIFIFLHFATLSNGLRARLIPPLSPESPYYNQVLEANNIPLSTSNHHVTLDRTHYIEWLNISSSLQSSRSNNDFEDERKYAEISYNKFSGYVMELHVGNPFQSVYGSFDTGSELIWFQCEGNPLSGSKFPNYNQSKSVTYKSVMCRDSENCDTQTSVGIRCGAKSCEFETEYADNTHIEGVMGVDVALTSPHGVPLPIPYLVFGCSSYNAKKNIMGIIGGGNGKYSFPRQLYPSDAKFSYCISFDMTKTYMAKFAEETYLAGSSTQVLKNNDTPYYYLDVHGIKLNNKAINVSPSEFKMSPDGKKGFIIDSGSTLSYFTPKVFDALKLELQNLLGTPVKHWIYDICYPQSQFVKARVKYKPTITIQFPEFDFTLPVEGMWETQKRDELLCLMIRRTEDDYSILGLMQLRDVNVGHDLTNDKLYLLETQCPASEF